MDEDPPDLSTQILRAFLAELNRDLRSKPKGDPKQDEGPAALSRAAVPRDDDEC